MSVRNNLPELMRAVETAVEFLEERQVGPGAANCIHLALEEMGTNIIKYGYDDTAEHVIQIDLHVGPEAVSFALADDGHPFNPLEMPEPNLDLGLDKRRPGGLGICLVRKMASDVQYARQEGRNVLTVTVLVNRK